MKLSSKSVVVAIVCCVLGAVVSPAQAAKILFIDSYHEGYPWSDGITKGVKSVIDGSGHELKVYRMDTKRNKSDDFKQQAAVKAKAEIASYVPDIVIAADDNVQSLVIVPHLKGGDTPVVFCGVNWNAGKYGYPASNVTGMLEVNAADELVSLLKQISKGDKIGYLTSENDTERKDLKNIKAELGLSFEKEVFVKTMDEWKAAFIELQSSMDAFVVMNNSGINDWDKAEAAIFAQENTKVPTGTAYDFMADYSMITYAKLAEEQGAWAAKTALDILGGKKVSSIPLSRNTQGKLIINARIIESAGVEVPDDIVNAADLIIE